MIVVAVLMTSCHVSEKPNAGPRNAQTPIEATAADQNRVRPLLRDLENEAGVIIERTTEGGTIGDARRVHAEIL